nr:hypothetical protein Iba_chr05fCG2080 [Ipomoea batatas]
MLFSLSGDFAYIVLFRLCMEHSRVNARPSPPVIRKPRRLPFLLLRRLFFDRGGVAGVVAGKDLHEESECSVLPPLIVAAARRLIVDAHRLGQPAVTDDSRRLGSLQFRRYKRAVTPSYPPERRRSLLHLSATNRVHFRRL